MELNFLSAPAPCGYLPDRTWTLHYEVSPWMRAPDYMGRLREGWRRFGPVLFRPECPSCRMCQSLRVPVNAFRTSRNQRRAWRTNAETVTIRTGSPTMTPEKLDLFERFHRHGYEQKGWPADAETDLDLFLLNPFATEEWSYYVDERLVGVGYVDVLPEGLSAIYFFHHPEERQRSLGTFNILKIIEAARRRGLPHVYLGYYVEGCRSLAYKARFRPNEVLREGRIWEVLAP